MREDAGPRPVLGGAERADDAPAPEPEPEENTGDGPDDKLGVEIEITPAGKSTKRLTLLSGGEKSMTALAFLFAVFLARPCPFYILDEVEAALDDLNIDRFLKVLRSFADRAQFIVVTHQKRTMEAADSLYGVSMAGNGVSKVISRKLPRAVEAGRRHERRRRGLLRGGRLGRRRLVGGRRRLGRRRRLGGDRRLRRGRGRVGRHRQRRRGGQHRRGRQRRRRAVASASSARRASSAASATSAAPRASAASAASNCHGCVGCIGCSGLTGAVGKIGVHKK